MEVNMSNEQSATTLVVLASIVCLLLGGVVGALAFPTTKEVPVIKEVVKEVQVPGPTVYVDKEVFKEVPVNVKTGYRDDAVKDFMTEVEDNDDFLVCGDESYDFDQVKLSKVYDEFSVTGDNEDYTVTAKVKLKYLDTDVEDKCYETYEFKVVYEEDEDPVVEVL
jgi:hypothetical protein